MVFVLPCFQGNSDGSCFSMLTHICTTNTHSRARGPPSLRHASRLATEEEVQLETKRYGRERDGLMGSTFVFISRALPSHSHLNSISRHISRFCKKKRKTLSEVKITNVFICQIFVSNINKHILTRKWN